MNNKSITERLNSVKDKGPDKWLSRSLNQLTEIEIMGIQGKDGQNRKSVPTPRKVQAAPTQASRMAAATANRAMDTGDAGETGGGSTKPPSGGSGGQPPSGGGGGQPPSGGGGGQPPSGSGRITPPSGGGDGARPPQFSFTDDTNSDQFKNAERIIENLESQIITGTQGGNSKLMKDRDVLLAMLKDPRRRDKAVKYLQVMNQQDEVLNGKREAMEELKDPKTLDDSKMVNFMQDHMGFRYSEGGLILPEEHNIIKRAFSAGLTNPNQKGGRFMSRQAFRQLFDPEARKILGTNNLQEIAKHALRNGIPLNKDLSDMLFNMLKSPSEYQNWAKEQGVAYLDPEDDIDMNYEMLQNPETGEMEYTGMTGLDLLKQSDPEAYYQQFNNNPRGMGRGKHLFHKNMINMGGDWVSGADELITPKRGTVDHIVSAGNRDADARDIESPLNLGPSGSGTNFHKVDMGDDPSDLAAYAQNYDDDKAKAPKGKNPAGITQGFAKAVFGGSPENLEQNRDSFWLLNRFLKSDFEDPKQQLDTLPPIEEFAQKQYNFNLPTAKQDGDSDNRFIKKFLDDPRGGNKIGQGLANLTTYYPRENHSNRKMTSWSGNPMRNATNWGEYKPLHNFKLALGLPSAFNHFPDFNGVEQQIREDVMSGNKRDKESEIAKRIEEAKAAHNRRRFQAPLQTRGAAWATGLIDNQEYLTELHKLLAQSKDFGLSVGGPQVNEMFDRGEKALDEYETLIKDQWPEGQLPSVAENEGWFDAMSGTDPVKKLAGSSYGRKVLPRDIVDKFDRMFNSGDVNKRGMSGFDPNDPTTFSEGELQLNPNNVL